MDCKDNKLYKVGPRKRFRKKEAYTTNVGHNLRLCDGVTLKHCVTFMPELHNPNGSNNFKNLQFASSGLVCSGHVWLVLAELLVPFQTGYTLSPLWPRTGSQCGSVACVRAYICVGQLDCAFQSEWLLYLVLTGPLGSPRHTQTDACLG